MKITIGLAAIATIFLIGCGGGSAAATPSNTQSTPTETKSDTTQVSYKTDENGKVLSIKLSASAEGVAVSDNALFVAEGANGVEVHKIGFDDTISSDFVTKIEGINAKSVTLSADGNRLYVLNSDGFVNVINISNLANPIKERVTTQQEVQKQAVTADKRYKFIPKDTTGLEIWDISTPSSPKLELTFNKSNAYDVVLSDSDTKALLAAGDVGINLLDVTNPILPNIIANFTLGGSVKGLSINEEQGLLFVANGDNGVLVYSLNVMLDMILKAK